ncbi:hypothetical protein Pedsa_2180 [Pseudopedobacter saltans DSM 12145]|uniref:Phosphoribosylpyrophosphate synthetase n=1 Tax=Pseudopedobacter saltans (strain ATCC 51119 / DSM 12145 / JCM 21818 / CCUG 39354 / LMG 10337 / NBRC 100064 / NCIMB 13643) TaxID=762903 RepID=F0SBP1_PSESL|nr:hypothetical protein [Pseudopedobacter saltans]ADY52732.1 hypothetical protein Pedsa_2180 [Pseudopedobacter saltans DSM 12145]
MDNLKHHRKGFDTMVEALNDLAARGYSGNLKLREHYLEEEEKQLMLYPEHFKVVETYRFEGMSDPEDNSIIYAIESLDGTFKGVLVNAYGAYAERASSDMIRALEIDHYH